MAVSAKTGRPVCEADLDWEHSPGQEIYSQFYEACRSLNYGDMCRLASAFNVSLATVIRWKSGRQFPLGLDFPFLVIQWVERGKPVRMRTQAEIAASMLARNQSGPCS